MRNLAVSVTCGRVLARAALLSLLAACGAREVAERRQEQATSEQLFSSTPVPFSQEQVEQFIRHAPPASGMPSGFKSTYIEYLRSQQQPRQLPPQPARPSGRSSSVAESSSPTVGYLPVTAMMYIVPPSYLSISKVNNPGKSVGSYVGNDGAWHPMLLSWQGSSPVIRNLDPVNLGMSTFAPASLDDNGIVVGTLSSKDVGPVHGDPAWLDSTELAPFVHAAPVGAVASLLTISSAAGKAAGLARATAHPNPACLAGVVDKGYGILGRYDSPKLLQSPFGDSISCQDPGGFSCQPGTFTSALLTHLVAVNDRGEAVGWSQKGIVGPEQLPIYGGGLTCEQHTSARPVYVGPGGSLTDLWAAISSALSLSNVEGRWDFEDGIGRDGVRADVVGINNDGLIVGTALGVQGFPYRYSGFTLNTRTSAVTALPSPYPYSSSNARAINNNGYILGYLFGDTGFTSVVWTPAGAVLDLGFPLVYGTISDGQVVGIGCPSYECALYRWDLPSGKITVSVQVTPNHVQPVASQCFDADQQIIYECATLQQIYPARSDVVKVTVSAVDQNGVAKTNGTVLLRANAEAGSGGHNHGVNGPSPQGRPTGTFYSATDDPSADPGTRAGMQGSLADTFFQYKTSGVGGTETITATVKLPDGTSAEAQAQVFIEVPGISEMARSGNNYDYEFKDPGTAHPTNNFGTQALQDALTQCFANYLAAMSAAGVSPPFIGSTSSRFVITDMGLPLGGLFDLDLVWTWPHKQHRFGRQADIRSQIPGPPPQAQMFDQIRLKALQRECSNVHPPLRVNQEANHFHLSLGTP